MPLLLFLIPLASSLTSCISGPFGTKANLLGCWMSADALSQSDPGRGNAQGTLNFWLSRVIQLPSRICASLCGSGDSVGCWVKLTSGWAELLIWLRWSISPSCSPRWIARWRGEKKSQIRRRPVNEDGQPPPPACLPARFHGGFGARSRHRTVDEFAAGTKLHWASRRADKGPESKHRAYRTAKRWD